MTLGRLVSAALAVLLSSACGSSTGNTSGGGSGAGGGATDGGGGDAGTGGDGGSATYTISVRINGNGGVRAQALGLDCRTACDAPGRAGTHVSFVPVADSGWTFDGWGGLCSGNGPCEVVVHSDRTLWATFVPATSDGGGGGSGEDGGSAQDGGSPGGFAIELHPTNAQGCEGIMPSSAPVPRSISLELKYSTSQGNWFDGLSVDGLGDVAAEFNSDHSDFPSDERRLVIYDLDGGVVGQVPGGFLKSQPDGFLSYRMAVDYGQAATPAWLSSRDGLPLVFVRGGRAYAAPSFVSSRQCQRRIELLLPDGTSCGTIDMREADDCAGGAPMVGARGTVLEVTPLDSYDGGTRTVEYRVFPRLLE